MLEAGEVPTPQPAGAAELRMWWPPLLYNCEASFTPGNIWICFGRKIWFFMSTSIYRLIWSVFLSVEYSNMGIGDLCCNSSLGQRSLPFLAHFHPNKWLERRHLCLYIWYIYASNDIITDIICQWLPIKHVKRYQSKSNNVLHVTKFCYWMLFLAPTLGSWPVGNLFF